MATVGKLIRVANPRRKRIKVRTRKRVGRKRAFRNRLGRFVKRSKVRKNPRRTKATTNKRHYKRKRATTKRKRSSGMIGMLKTELRRLGISNPRRRSKARNKRKSYRRRRVSNPVLIELGAINPRRKKRSHMARRKRKYTRRRNPRRVARRRRRNTPPTWAKAIGYRRKNRRRRRNPSRVNHRRRRHYSRRHNPAVFGRSSGKDLLMMTGGVLVGVAATKYLPTLIPASLTASLGTGSFVSVLVTGAGAFAAGFLARKVSPGAFADAVLLGGLAQTASAALNAFAPPTWAGRLALSGVGDIIPGSYVVPQNPIKAAVMPISAGMGAFKGAFGGRR